MAKAKKTKSGKWTIRVYAYQDEDGRQHFKRITADTKDDCEYLAKKYKRSDRKKAPKTKLMNAFLKGIGVERSALVLTAEPNEMLDLMVRNLPRVDSATAQEINPYAVLLFKNIVADKAGFDALMARAAGKEAK